MSVTPTEKPCRQCGITKPLDAFGLEKRGKYGRRSKCRVCHTANQAAYRDRNRADIQAKGRAYQARVRQEAPEKLRAALRKWYAKNGAEWARCYRANPEARNRIRLLSRARYWQDPEKGRESARRWARQHPEKIKHQSQSWRRANADRYRQYKRAYYAMLPESKRRDLSKRLHEHRRETGYYHLLRYRNRDKIAHTQRLRYLANVSRSEIVLRDNSTCYLCRQRLTDKQITLDHVIPLKRKGSHTPDNLRVACRRCNSRKGAKLLSELAWYTP